ncbi:hypothetical protein [Marinifilum caeruleilacunae]|nr:hypothetical protein [Marinifilum caeruleilacunae]
MLKFLIIRFTKHLQQLNNGVDRRMKNAINEWGDFINEWGMLAIDDAFC